MDCCNTNTKKENREESVKGGKSMAKINKKTMLWIVIGILLIATIFLTFKASSIGTGAAQTIGTGAAQTTASATRTAVSTASSGMVGGC